MSGEWAGYIFMFCIGSISIILMFLTVISFADPSAFVRWFSPLHWFTRHILRDQHGKFDPIFATIFGFFSFTGLLVVSFILGGLFVTAAFNLWNSPFARLVFPQ